MGILDGLSASRAVLAGQILGTAIAQFREFYDCFQICADTATYIEKFSYILGYMIFILGFSIPLIAVLKCTEILIHQQMGFSFKRYFRSSVEQILIPGFVGILASNVLTYAWVWMKDEAKCIRFNDCERGFNQIILDIKLNVCNVPIGPDGLPIQTDSNICEVIFNATPLILTTCLSAALYRFRNYFEVYDLNVLAVRFNNGVTRNPLPTNQGPRPIMAPYPIARPNAEGFLESEGTIPLCQNCKSPYKCLCHAGTRLPSEKCEAPKNSDSDSSDKENEAHSSPAMKPVFNTTFPPGCKWGIICLACRTTFKCSCKKSPKDNKGDKSDGRKSRSVLPKNNTDSITSSESKTGPSTKENETQTLKRGRGRPKKPTQTPSKSPKTGKKSESESEKKTDSTTTSESKAGFSSKEIETGIETPIKRGRGRPKKETETPSKSPKTGKKSKSESEKKTDSTTSSESESGFFSKENETGTPTKKGPGRAKEQMAEAKKNAKDEANNKKGKSKNKGSKESYLKN